MPTPLKVERKRRGMTLEDLATAVGVKQPTICRIENASRKASPELADRIAKFLDNAVTRDQILFPKDYVSQDVSSAKPPRLKKAS